MKSIRTEGSEGMLKENVRKGIKVNGTIPFPNGFPKLLVWNLVLGEITSADDSELIRQSAWATRENLF